MDEDDDDDDDEEVNLDDPDLDPEEELAEFLKKNGLKGNRPTVSTNLSSTLST